MTPREEKGLQIAAEKRLKGKGLHWFVPSQSSRRRYKVVMTDDPHCTCPDFEFRGQPCKHIFAVEYTILQQIEDDGSKTTTESVKITYSQNWKIYNMAQTHEREYFEILLSKLCANLPEPSRKTGNSPGGRKPLPWSDMTYSAIMKVFETVSARRFASYLREAELKGFISKAPHFNSVLNHFEREEFTDALQEMIVESSRPLSALESHFAIDSSGFSTSVKGNWHDTKYKRRYDPNQRFWVKCHIMTGVLTNVVTACRIGHEHDLRMLPDLVDATSRNFSMREISADKAYSSKESLELIDSYGAFPLIPFRDKAGMGTDNELWARMFHYFSFHRDEFAARYHKRSNVESTFRMIQAKFGGHIRSKGKRAQLNEVLCKIVCHNIVVLIQSMLEFGISIDFTRKN